MDASAPDATYFARYLKVAPHEWALVSPGGVGDIFLVAALAGAFAERHQAESVSLVVPQRLAEAAYGHTSSLARVIAVADIPQATLRAAAAFEPGVPLVAQVEWAHGGAYLPFLGFKGFTLLDAYRLLLRLPPDAPLTPPHRSNAQEDEALALVEKLGLPRGRTVVLAPAAQTLRPPPAPVWHALAHALAESGWRVCVNRPCPDELCPPRALPVEIPLRLLAPVAERLGWVVATRNGLCDLLAFARCHLTVLYTPHLRPSLEAQLRGVLPGEDLADRIFAASSLRAMGLSTRVIEVRDVEPDLVVASVLRSAPPLPGQSRSHD